MLLQVCYVLLSPAYAHTSTITLDNVPRGSGTTSRDATTTSAASCLPARKEDTANNKIFSYAKLSSEFYQLICSQEFKFVGRSARNYLAVHTVLSASPAIEYYTVSLFLGLQCSACKVFGTKVSLKLQNFDKTHHLEHVLDGILET